MPLKFIDLFAGLGGFHFALSELGHECVFASELREDLRKLYAINFPGTRIEGDITSIRPEDIPAHDILCAGFPCQPFSQAGKRQGFNDEKNRGNLFTYICKIIEYHRPRYVFLENVSNLKGHDGGSTWQTIHRMLDKELNYEVAEPAILSPHQWGIPQHRRRIYIVCENREMGNLKNFRFPIPPKSWPSNIKQIIDEDDSDFIKLKADTRQQLALWQEFIDFLWRDIYRRLCVAQPTVDAYWSLDKLCGGVGLPEIRKYVVNLHSDIHYQDNSNTPIVRSDYKDIFALNAIAIDEEAMMAVIHSQIDKYIWVLQSINKALNIEELTITYETNDEKLRPLVDSLNKNRRYRKPLAPLRSDDNIGTLTFGKSMDANIKEDE